MATRRATRWKYGRHRSELQTAARARQHDRALRRHVVGYTEFETIVDGIFTDDRFFAEVEADDSLPIYPFFLNSLSFLAAYEILLPRFLGISQLRHPSVSLALSLSPTNFVE